ncbi:GAF and ANTAR domain-containing protein [Nocardioides sp. LHD-245]|uniref:GAF and ANTAR domain-containing protein n=1 Tax=Nocardioides sp. LHD-245 TaxID=3051387 RepID=UPI0027E027A6|nr:GAF and ANTAR domain-containing protein [Nocardioides sp. LHD-245]
MTDLLCIDCAQSLRLAGVGMTLMNDAGHQAVIGTSGTVASRLEEIQFDLGEGPSLDASRTNRTVGSDDLGDGVLLRWPAFASAALVAGISAVTAVPLGVGGVRLGSLSMYRSSPGRLDEQQRATAHAYGGAAVVVLLHLQERIPSLDLSRDGLHPDLGAPVAYRAEIHQATGFLAVRAAVGMTEALLLLRAHAFAADRSLLDVARDVLAGRLRIHPKENEDD